MCIYVLTLTSLVDPVVTRSRRALVLELRAEAVWLRSRNVRRWSWPRSAALCVVPATGLSARPARAVIVPVAPSCFLVAHTPLYFGSSAVLNLNSTTGESRCSSRNLSVKAWGNLQTKQPLDSFYCLWKMAVPFGDKWALYSEAWEFYWVKIVHLSFII